MDGGKAGAWNLRLKAGFGTVCCVRVGGFVRRITTPEVSQAAFPFEVGSAAPWALAHLRGVLQQLERESTGRGSKKDASSPKLPCSKVLAQGSPSTAGLGVLPRLAGITASIVHTVWVCAGGQTPSHLWAPDQTA